MQSFYATCEEKLRKLLQGAITPVSGFKSGQNGALHSGDSPQGLGFRTPPNKKENIKTPRSGQNIIDMSKLSGPIQELHLNCTSIIEYANSPLDQRLDKLRRYGDAPALPLDMVIPVFPSVHKEFHIPKKINSPVESPPLSLDSDSS